MRKKKRWDKDEKRETQTLGKLGSPLKIVFWKRRFLLESTNF